MAASASTTGNLSPEQLYDGREKVEVYNNTAGELLALAIASDEDLQASVYSAEVDFADIAYELDFERGLMLGTETAETFDEYAENLKPRGQGGWNDLQHDLLCFLDDEFELQYKNVNQEYEDALDELEKKKDRFTVDVDRAIDIFRAVARNYIKAGGDVYNLVVAGYAIAQFMWGPEEGEGTVTRVMAAISDALGTRDDDRTDARNIQKKTKKDDRAEDVFVRARSLEGTINRGDPVDWDVVSPLVEAYQEAVAAGWQDEDIGKVIKGLEKKYKPEEPEKKNIFKVMRDLLKRLLTKKDEDDGGGESDEVVEVSDDELEFWEKLVRVSAGMASIRKMLVLEGSAVGAVPWIGASVSASLVYRTMGVMKDLADQGGRRIWNMGVVGWRAFRQRKYDLWADERYESIWEDQLRTAGYLRRYVVDLVTEVHNDGNPRTTVVSYVGPEDKEVEITVTPGMIKGEFDIEYKWTGIANSESFTLTLPQSISGSPFFHNPRRSWIRGQSKFEQGLNYTWQQATTLKQAKADVISHPAVTASSVPYEQATNRMIFSLGALAARDGLDLYQDGLGYILPSARRLRGASINDLLELETALQNLDYIQRGWAFLCQCYTGVDVGVMNYLLYPDEEVDLKGNIYYLPPNILGDFYRIDDIFQNNNRLSLSQRLDLLKSLMQLGQAIGTNKHIQGGVIKRDVDLDEYFAKGSGFGNARGFYGKKPARIAGLIESERRKVRERSFGQFVVPAHIVRILSRV